ncbi:hypothetical protein [Actinacidiphila acididurans]|uniref:Uncharacterized protein n=1 Tax=Actinacidiphila acididurans TaxID=2784346 RepID=A0ABS2TTD6_9ACTN|nr:hypothetical protein [Actinacidiphila acididurans]MBM9506597.1 hypothetical protein [Actinacidiphila acididurans]
MNAPVHFKQQLADELNARAASLSAPAGNRAPLRLRAPRRRMALTIGAVAAAAAVAVALPLASGTHSTRQTAPTPPGAVSTGGLDIVNADYAVQSKPGGMVAIRLFDPKGVPGLQAALDKAGIPAVVLTPTASCHATVQRDLGDRGNVRKVVLHSKTGRDPALINPAAIPSGDTLLFTAYFNAGRPGPIGYALVRQAPACVPVGFGITVRHHDSVRVG